MLSFILIILAASIFTGIVNRVRSLVSGRKGPGLFQPIRDVVRLFRKGSVYSDTCSWIFKLAPSVSMATVLMAMLVIPFARTKGVLSFEGDFVFFAYVLALGKFFSIIASWDTGNSFEGMGASREALYSTLAEPAFFILIGSFAMLTGYTSFYDIFRTLHFGSYISYLLGLLATFVLITLAMIENSRMPVDDPRTHLELTMIHEVMILDNSGFDLGLILSTSYLKFALYGALIANFFIDIMPWYIAIPSFFGIQFLVAIAVGIWESFTARFRMSHNPQFIFILSSVSLLIFFGVMLVLHMFN
ncbi:MAG: NADH-quinone oxidoreductase subunit H [Bacteroidetes bacterium]|nr:NADH-quinone oxidoreductase subunit H [Bacteroidota bacterium]